MVPEKQRFAPERLHEIIRTMVPEAEEVISYQVSTFKYNGKLVGFAALRITVVSFR